METEEIRKKLKEALEGLKEKDAAREIREAASRVFKQDGIYLSDRELATIDLDDLSRFVEEVVEIRFKLDDQYNNAAKLLVGDDNAGDISDQG